jgi:hypothetical protein
MSFFRDSDGNWSFGRLASFILVIGAIMAALLSKDYGAMLATALGFYSASKAQQAIKEYHAPSGSPASTGEAS